MNDSIILTYDVTLPLEVFLTRHKLFLDTQVNEVIVLQSQDTSIYSQTNFIIYYFCL